MAKLVWDKTGEHLYETGVDHGVLYFPDQTGAYKNGVAWNGLISVSESPSGAEATGQYADNIKYLNLISAEEFGATIEAYTYPEEFEACNGNKELVDDSGVYVGQQSRSVFGFCYRTMIGNDTDGQDHGYKLHLVYGCQVSPSEKAYQTINDSPEALTFSWELSTTPVNVTGKKPTALLVIDSTKIDSTKLAKIEAKLYGDETSAGAVLPTPDEIAEILSAA
nr:MAG TPA: tail tube protein [Caudoviricetes sp.]